MTLKLCNNKTHHDRSFVFYEMWFEKPCI